MAVLPTSLVAEGSCVGEEDAVTAAELTAVQRSIGERNSEGGLEHGWRTLRKNTTDQGVYSLKVSDANADWCELARKRTSGPFVFGTIFRQQNKLYV